MIENTKDDSWQPIETAPRDGTKIIVYGKHAQTQEDDQGGQGGLIVTIGHYLGGLDCWVTSGGVMYDATQWLPLPEPQKQAPKRKTEGKTKSAILKKIEGMRGQIKGIRRHHF